MMRAIGIVLLFLTLLPTLFFDLLSFIGDRGRGLMHAINGRILYIGCK